MLKVRVRVLEHMTVREMWDRIQRAAESRVVPSGIELMVMDWEREGGGRGRVQSGSYIGDDLIDALHLMIGLMRAGKTRVRHAE